MNMVFSIAAGGAIGAVMRHYMSHWFAGLNSGDFPLGILACNIIGAFLMGLLIEMSVLHWSFPQEWRAFLVVGILGSFTTFSSFALETILLMQRGQAMLAVIYVSLSVSVAILALMGAMFLVRHFE